MSTTRGMRIQLAMRERSFTKLSALAAAVGVTESAISRWCHDGTITTENVVNLCTILDISIDWLLLGRGHMGHGVVGAAGDADIARMMERMSPRAREHLVQLLDAICNARG